MAKVTVALACPGLRWRKWRHVTHPCHHVVEYHSKSLQNHPFELQNPKNLRLRRHIQLYPATARLKVYIHSYIHSFKLAKVDHGLGLKWRKWGPP